MLRLPPIMRFPSLSSLILLTSISYGLTVRSRQYFDHIFTPSVVSLERRISCPAKPETVAPTKRWTPSYAKDKLMDVFSRFVIVSVRTFSTERAEFRIVTTTAGEGDSV